MMKKLLLIGMLTTSFAAQADCVSEVLRIGESGREVAEEACRLVKDTPFGEECLYWAIKNPYESVPSAMWVCRKIETQENFDCIKDYAEKNKSDVTRASHKCDPDYDEDPFS